MQGTTKNLRLTYESEAGGFFIEPSQQKKPPQPRSSSFPQEVTGMMAAVEAGLYFRAAIELFT